MVLALLLAAASLGGCDRLNPDWCAQKASCATNEYCDPATNTCQPREAGVPDARGDQAVDAGRDGLTDRAVVDQQPAGDGTVDLKVD